MKRIVSAVFSYAILICVLVISLYPFYLIWITALKGPTDIYKNPLGLPTSVHLENLVRAWTQGKFSLYLQNSIIISVPTVLFVITLSSLAGFSFAKLRFFGRRVLFLVLIAGTMLPTFGIIIPLYLELRDMVLLNTHWSVILPLTGFGVSFGAFMMRGFFDALPSELLDSCRMDGCSNVKAFAFVFAPMAKSAFMALIVLEFMWSWNVFILPLVFITSESLRPIQMGLMYAQSRYDIDYGLLAGIVTLATLPIVAVYVAFQNTFVRGLTQGALKG